MRLDILLANKNPDFSRSMLQKLIKNGQVKVDGAVKTKGGLDVADDAKIEIVSTPAIDFKKDKLKLEKAIIFEDDNCLVINKPAGVLVHQKGGLDSEWTVADLVKDHFDKSELKLNKDNNRLGIVHRLDRATSGVMVCAKNLATASFLAKQFSERKAKKTYLAITEAIPKINTARIDLPITRNPKRPASFMVDASGKTAITDYEVVAELADKKALIKLQPLTGRTHQLRVHLNYLHAPIMGDSLYGINTKKRTHFKNSPMFLHAYQLEITLPVKDGDNIRKTFKAKLPSYFKEKIGGAVEL